MTRKRLPVAALLLFALPALAATLSGTVTDRTTGKVAAADTVVLIGFGQGMQEVARATTDARGRYTLQLPDTDVSGATHLIRVDHQKATYFQPAPAGTRAVDVDVYDVAESVPGIQTEADVLTVQTDPGGLHVVENYFVRNDSHPAMTQLSRRAYEFYLPAGARVEATAAMGPGGMPVASSPIPVGDPQNDPGHYAFVFPIRPGETRFQVSYHLAYSGTLALSQRVALPTQNLVVILPRTMQFTPRGSEFQTVPDNVAAQTFVRKGVSPGQPVAFTLSGSGVMPRDAQQGESTSTAQGGSSTAQGGPTAAQPDADTRPGGGLGPPIDTPDPLHKYKWAILSGLALLLVVAAALLLRKPPSAAVTAAAIAAPPPPPPYPAAMPAPALAAPPGHPAPGGRLLAALKETLFALEAERLNGHISLEEYTQLKASLEVVLRQVLEHEAATR
ncbi:MAG TPA: carboxypeptidase regulatory-like domain-containing protein [Acidobacteriaceae bacterium]